ncbi:MAG: amidohydrolase [Clostridia bacterium]|nr:amidohydrolase [Clostridia bacterium]
MTYIADSHCHIYPEKIALKAVASVEDFYEKLPRQPWNGTAEELVRSGNEAGITHFIVFSVATNPRQVSSINRFIARSVLESGGRMAGLGAMHPDSDDFERDLDEIRSLGLKGVKLHPDIQRFAADDPRAMKIYGLCEERGLPVCIHAGDKRYDYSNPERMAHVAEAFPALKIQAAHLGGWSVWEEASLRLARYPNVLVDCSSSLYWLDRDKAREIIRRYGAERVLFGTDYPFWPQKRELEDLCALGLSDGEYERILWRNAAELYGLRPGDTEGEDKADG